MKRSKKSIGLFIVILIIIVIVGYFMFKRLNSNDRIVGEYTPQEEVNDDQLRKTIVKLYYVDKQDNKIKSTTKVLDSVELVDNPYKKIIELLIEDENDSKFVLPENTRVYDASIDKKIVTVNFSKEILNFKSEEEKNNITNILANTLSELTEVNGVKIKVEGQDNDQYKDTYVKK